MTETMRVSIAVIPTKRSAWRNLQLLLKANGVTKASPNPAQRAAGA